MKKLVILLTLIFYPIKSHFQATISEITPEIQAKMKYTWHDDSPVPLEYLRYLELSHYDFEGNERTGEIIVHKLVADDVVEIFKKLFESRFPITSIKLVDDFEGSDDLSMQANNSSAFYARKVARSDRWSNHSFGTAIDINPQRNPYHKGDFFCPKNGERYLDRTLNEPGMISRESLIYQLFIEKGWEWGGECFMQRDGTCDLHHFQKVIPGLNKNTN